jgi:hypothetical protein
MLIARWQIRAKFGKTDAVVALLQKWEADVGQRIGWRLGSVRIARGKLGVGAGDVEFEVRVDTLNDLESAWADMKAVPYHAQYMQEIEPMLDGGSATWVVLEEAVRS